MEVLHPRTEQVLMFSEARINYITFTCIMNSHIVSFTAKNLVFYRYILHHTREFSWLFVMDWSREIAVHLFKLEFIVYKWYVLENIGTY